MTDDNAFKRKARKHQQATGDSYMRARRQVDVNHANTNAAAPTNTLLTLLAEPTTEALRIPLGLQADGTPVWLDLRDEADGGNGPHGLIVGTTGSGKTTALTSLTFALCTRYSPEQVQFILADPRKHSGFDDFADYPHVRATFTDLERVEDAATTLVDTIRGVLDERARTLHDLRRTGSPFDTIGDYQRGHTEPSADPTALPFIFVVVDDLSALCRHRPDVADSLTALTRKGRALGVHLVASTATIGHPLPRDLFDNLVFRITLRTTTEAESRRMIGTPAAAHLPSDRRGVGWITAAPGANPLQFTGFHPSRSVITAASRRSATGQ